MEVSPASQQSLSNLFDLDAPALKNLYSYLPQGDRQTIRLVSQQAMNSLSVLGCNPKPKLINRPPLPSSFTKAASLGGRVLSKRARAVAKAATRIKEGLVTAVRLDLSFKAYIRALATLFQKGCQEQSRVYPLILLLWMTVSLPSPVLVPVAQGIPLAICGLVETAIWSLCFGCAVGNHPGAARHGLRAKCRPQEARIVRIFAKRMAHILDIVAPTPEDRERMRHAPELLVGFAALAIAFRSRNDGEGILTLREKKNLSRKGMARLGQNWKIFFEGVHALKQCMKDLDLDDDDAAAWIQLGLAIREMHKQFVHLPLRSDLNVKVKELITGTLGLSKLVVADPSFQKVWCEINRCKKGEPINRELTIIPSSLNPNGE